MLFEEYKENYNYAPYPVEDFAEGATEIEDRQELARLAKAFLDAKFAFEVALEVAGVAIG